MLPTRSNSPSPPATRKASPDKARQARTPGEATVFTALHEVRSRQRALDPPARPKIANTATGHDSGSTWTGTSVDVDESQPEAAVSLRFHTKPSSAQGPGSHHARVNSGRPAADILFTALDADGDGVITQQEMRQGLASGGQSSAPWSPEQPASQEDVQSRLDQLRSLLSDTREQLHESSLALSPALGVPDVDDSQVSHAHTAGLGSSYGADAFALDTSSIAGGTVRARPTAFQLLASDFVRGAARRWLCVGVTLACRCKRRSAADAPSPPRPGDNSRRYRLRGPSPASSAIRSEGGRFGRRCAGSLAPLILGTAASPLPNGVSRVCQTHPTSAQAAGGQEYVTPFSSIIERMAQSRQRLEELSSGVDLGSGAATAPSDHARDAFE